MATRSKVSKKDVPSTEQESKPVPSSKIEKKPVPQTKYQHPENVVVIGTTPIEIKSCSVGYMRSGAAAFYHTLRYTPLPDILARDNFGLDADGKPISGETLFMRWLVAVTNEPKVCEENFDNIDVETVERLLEVFDRVNKITEKEEARKKFEESQMEMMKKLAG